MHLPKGVKILGADSLDTKKENLIINFTEDEQGYLLKMLQALDAYFKLNTSNYVKNRFNVVLTWATSTEDTLKVLKVAGDRIKKAFDTTQQALTTGFEGTRIFFWNDVDFRIGTGPNFWIRPVSAGTELVGKALEFVPGIEEDKVVELKQTGNKKIWIWFGNIITPIVKGWDKLTAEQIAEATKQIALRFSKKENVGFDKLSEAVDPASNKYNGIEIPLKSFMRFIEEDYS